MKRNLLLIGAMCLIAAMAFSVFNIYRYFNPYLDREIMGPVTITSEWLEIVPKEPLRAERQIQMIVLDLDKSIEVERNGWGLILPDGSVVTPEVQLIAQDGDVYNLTHPSVWQSPSTGITFREFSLPNLPKDKFYRAVCIRSEKPINCNRIFWRNYNQWDVS